MDEWKWNMIEICEMDYHCFLFCSFEIHNI
jgi:hypothetical protein